VQVLVAVGAGLVSVVLVDRLWKLLRREPEAAGKIRVHTVDHCCLDRGRKLFPSPNFFLGPTQVKKLSVYRPKHTRGSQ